MVWLPTPQSRTSSCQAPSLLPLYIHTLFPVGLLFYPTLCEWGHNTKAARTLSCFLLTAKKHVNLVRRSSTKPTPGKATPTHVTQSSALTWLLCNTYFPVYYTLVTTVELHLTLKSTYCSPIQHIILKYPENDSIYYISSYTLYKPYMLHVLSSIPCAQCTPYIYNYIYILYLPYLYRLYTLHILYIYTYVYIIYL